MIVNKTNIRDILEAKDGKKKCLWVTPGAFSSPYKLFFIGYHDGSAMFVNSAGKLESIDMSKPTGNKALKEGRITTDHDTAVVVLRELCVEEIQHFNGRILKNNPI